MIFRRKNDQYRLRLRTLALLPLFIAVILISSTFMLIVSDNLMRTQTIFEDSSTSIFDAETSSQLGYSMQLHQLSISQAIKSNNHSLISLQELYTLIQNQQQNIHTQTYPEFCLDDCDDPENCEQFGFQSKQPLDLEYSALLNFTRLLNEYIFEFKFFNDSESIISFIDYGNKSFYLQYPIFFDISLGQSLSTDRWIRDFKQSNLSNQLMPPIFNFVNGPMFLIHFNQLKVGQSVKGAFRYEYVFYLSTFPELYNIAADQDWNIQTYFGVLNYLSEEQIIFDPKSPEINITFSSMTGFSQADWVKVMSSEQSKVYNNFLDTTVYTKRQKFWNSDMLLVVFQDVSSYLLQQDQIMAQLQAFGTEVIKKFFITILTCIFACGVLKIVLIIKILQPFARLTSMVQVQIYSINKNDVRQSFSQQLEFRSLEVNQSLKELYSAIIKQEKRTSQNKSGLCQIYQQFNYPIKTLKLEKLNLKYIPQYAPISSEMIQQLFQNTHF